MILQGQLYAESPIYRGNARKTLFTRDGDGTQRLVSLAGEVAGTAQSLMDAFVGASSSGKNLGLLNQLWQRLYDAPMPSGLISKVDCRLQEGCYPRDRFFDIRMGIKLDEDRWAAEANANYKVETLFRNSVFDFSMQVNDAILQQGNNTALFYYLLQELKEGRFWFGAGKSKGMGKLRLKMDLPFAAPQTAPRISSKASYLSIALTFNAQNPVLVGWNWGRVEPDVPTFAAIEGRLLVEAMRDLPDGVRKRLAIAIGGPILSPEDWKRRMAEYLPRTMAIWLRELAFSEVEGWVLPAVAVEKLGKGKFALSAKVMDSLRPLTDKPFANEKAAEEAVNASLGAKANMAKRVLAVLEKKSQARQQFDKEAWVETANSMGMDAAAAESLAAHIQSETELVTILKPECAKILPQLYQQVDRQVKLIQSDAWIDTEIANREEHLLIKTMLSQGKIEERQWRNPENVPAGVRAAAWQEFVEAHKRVQFQHMLNAKNLQKSIANDQNFIGYLKAYRDRARQELAQPYNTDFRAGGVANREVSRKYGKPFDTMFMRMLSWVPSSKGDTFWEIYIPGSTIKGAFRKRASQILKTLWSDSTRITELLNRLFGTQGQRGLVFFSDAYLATTPDPHRSWCAMDGVRMNPKTGQPIEEAKADYLYAYGEKLIFQLRIEMQDLEQKELQAISLLAHLLMDFQKGEIPLGGDKTNGFGWVEADINELVWLADSKDVIGSKLLGKQEKVSDGIWQKTTLSGKAAKAVLQDLEPLTSTTSKAAQIPPKADLGFVSHRSFGGYCGTLMLEGLVLTPISVAESGEPSFRAVLPDGMVNGCDFFSMSPPEAAQRDALRVYALPSKSIKGTVRHLYSIASDSAETSENIRQLTPADSLFGWVGRGPNQALAGRLSISFAPFVAPELAWFKVPYPYGEWQFEKGVWKELPGSTVHREVIDNTWRLFPHTPLAPIVRKISDFTPDTAQASYFRAILPEARCRFSVRFWNLDKEELQRLIWCLVLEQDLAHKMGRCRYLGFGGIRFRILPESYLIDWAKRYVRTRHHDWKLPLTPEEWIEPKSIKHYSELRKALDAKQL